VIGATFGRYRVLEAIGEGGMGRVWLAEDPALSRRVAVKLLPPEFAADAERRERLRLEARSASALNHPNIVTIHDLGEEQGSLFVAMEYVDGPTLRAWSAQAKRAPAEITALALQAVRGLAVAHAAGLVHRDLKPENVMVRTDGIVKVLDFGLARSASPREQQATMLRTEPGVILGTAPYMSPEQVLGKPAGPPSDVFSLGTILYEMLTARHPFDAGTAVDTMHRILHETPPGPSTLVPALPAAFDFVLAKALAKDPARRYANAGEFELDLETCAAALAQGAPARAPAAGGAAASPSARALAVLPFKNLGGNPDLDHLGLGLADAVITRLSGSPDLVVRATSSIARYAGKLVDPRDVARELDVHAVLDASFQRAGARFRATARLVEFPGEKALWAGKIDVDFDDIFEVQDRVAIGIAEALEARITERRAGAYVPPPEVYEMYLRALEPFRGASHEGFVGAIALLERAVERAPEYADAWALLGKLRQSMYDAGHDPDPKWLGLADEAVARALALDPDHAYAHFTQASLDLVRGRKAKAYHALVAIVRARPNESHALHYLAYVLRLANRVDSALEADRRAMESDPGSPFPYWMHGRIAVESGRLELAKATAAKARARFPMRAPMVALEMAILLGEKRFPETVALAESFGATAGEMGRGLVELAYALLRLGRVDEARAIVERLEPHARNDMDNAAYSAALAGWLGEFDAAFAHLDRATQLGNDSLYLYEREDLFGPLHADPRWAPFLAGVRARCADWEREFTWPN